MLPRKLHLEEINRFHIYLKLGNGTYEPKVLKRDKVKEVLLSFRQNLARDKDISRVREQFNKS